MNRRRRRQGLSSTIYCWDLRTPMVRRWWFQGVKHRFWFLFGFTRVNHQYSYPETSASKPEMPDRLAVGFTSQKRSLWKKLLNDLRIDVCININAWEVFGQRMISRTTYPLLNLDSESWFVLRLTHYGIREVNLHTLSCIVYWLHNQPTNHQVLRLESEESTRWDPLCFF